MAREAEELYGVEAAERVCVGGRQSEARNPLSRELGRGWGSRPFLATPLPSAWSSFLSSSQGWGMVTLCTPPAPRDIQDRSIIKIYRKEPLYAAFPGSHLTNGDLRVWLGRPRALGRLGRWGPGAQSLATCHQGQLWRREYGS